MAVIQCGCPCNNQVKPSLSLKTDLLPVHLNLLQLCPDLLDLLDDDVLGPHLGGEVGHAPGQGDHVALQPLEPLVVVLVLPRTAALSLLPRPLVLVVVEVAAADAGDAGQAGHAAVHLPPGYP